MSWHALAAKSVGMTASVLPITLSPSELKAITGYAAPTAQLRELHRLGFSRARKGADGRLILERAHYEAVCAGATVFARGEAPVPAQAPGRASKAHPAPQMIRVEDWAASLFAEPPSSWVLGRWRREGLIHPPPVRVGRSWFVRPDAKYMQDGVPYSYVPLVERLKGR